MHAPKTLLVVYHSMTRGTEQLATAAAAGGREEGIGVAVRCAAQAQLSDLLSADGYLFATPENLGSMSGMMKDFFDRCYYGALERLNGRAYASLICAGSDGRGAAQQLEKIATGWRLRAVAPALIICTRAQTPEAILAPKRIEAAQLGQAADLGRMLASGLSLGIF